MQTPETSSWDGWIEEPVASEAAWDRKEQHTLNALQGSILCSDSEGLSRVDLHKDHLQKHWESDRCKAKVWSANTIQDRKKVANP